MLPLPKRCDLCQRVLGDKEMEITVPGTGARLCRACMLKYAAPGAEMKIIRRGSQYVEELTAPPKPKNPSGYVQPLITDTDFTVETDGK